MENLGHVESALRVLADAKDKSADAHEKAFLVARIAGSSLKLDRYDYYFAEEKEMVYEIDKAGSLSAFNDTLRSQSYSDVHAETDVARTFFIAAALG